MRLEFSSFVEPDLDAIAAFIAEDNPVRALSFIREIRERLQSVARAPHLYRLRPEIGEEARLAMHGNYVILFRITPVAVRVERIAYGGRDLSALYEVESNDR